MSTDPDTSRDIVRALKQCRSRGIVCINGEELTFDEMSARYPGWRFTAIDDDGSEFVVKPDAGQVESFEPRQKN